MSSDPGGLPRYPIKTVLPVAALLLLLQGVSEIVKHLRAIAGERIDESFHREEEAM